MFQQPVPEVEWEVWVCCSQARNEMGLEGGNCSLDLVGAVEVGGGLIDVGFGCFGSVS